ncbi:hypothetical protein [Ralstonia sp. ASV6]|uniref:hypothetical protein n=1 Tax=Ralstonia sp. ASV6 TaxID=2795124 RepID=UPI0018EC8B46|nr:hypothetical protein [Ralstonia sp. ASV6]
MQTASYGVETHPTYTFIRFGRARDFDPSFSDDNAQAGSIEHWWIEIVDELYVWPVAYTSREELLRDIDDALFSDRHAELVARQIKRAERDENIGLASLLREQSAANSSRVRAEHKSLGGANENGSSTFDCSHRASHG